GGRGGGGGGPGARQCPSASRALGSGRIRLEMLRKPRPWVTGGLVVPSERTIERILHRQGLLHARPRKRPKDLVVAPVAGRSLGSWRLRGTRRGPVIPDTEEVTGSNPVSPTSKKTVPD